MSILSNADIADTFVTLRSTTPGESAVDLEPRIRLWLADSGMSHRLPDAWQIAREAEELIQAAPAPPLPERFEFDLQEGYGDPPVDVVNMTMAEYAAARDQLGVTGRRDSGLFGRL
jgi:hypothetical protein